MKNFSIILFSDIHFGGRPSENQNPVLDAFCKDVLEVCKNRKDTIYLFCVGDLVQAADSSQLYDDFKKDILDKVCQSLKIDQGNVLIIPGNHDAQKSEIDKIKNDRFKKVKSLEYESDFNDYIRTEPSVESPFKNFRNLADRYPNSKWETSSFTSFSIDDSCKVACLNSALLTFAHIDNEKDSRYLGIDTRSLSEWITANRDCKKILLMHHPLEDLSVWANAELVGLINTNFDLVITGHTHSQFIGSPLGTEVDSIHCRLPHLFHDKHENAMGYAVIDFHENNPYQIQYREWNNRRHRFVPGTSFVDDDGGILELKASNIVRSAMTSSSLIEADIDLQLRDAMKAYSGIPELKWEDRLVSTQPVENYTKIPSDQLLSENEVVAQRGDVMILSPRDYGLTCYGLHFAKVLFQNFKEKSVFIGNPNIKINTIQDLIKTKEEQYNISGKDIGWFIIDEWILSKEKEKELLSFFHETFPDARLLLLSPRPEKFFTSASGLISRKEIQYLHLTPLSRTQLRHIASSFNKYKYIAEEDILLKRLDNDIRSFNMHRSPMNCINLLYVFGSSFDRNPINRTQVLERVLNLIFDNDTPPVYSTTPDIKDCIRVLGILSKNMIKTNVFNFTRMSFVNLVNEYSMDQDLTIDSNYLFDLLLRNHIIIPEIDRFRFKASYWVYFFAACRMQTDKEFAEFIVKDERYMNYPMILEFFSGLSRQENGIIQRVTQDLDTVISNVKNKIGLPKGWAPYNMIKIKSTEAQKKRVLDSLDGEIRGSNLPMDVKDVMADIDYDQRKPFHQDVFKILNKYEVGTLMNFVPIASRVLRNSDYADRDLRRLLFSKIIESWKTLLDAISLFAPVLALKGEVSFGGALFIFVDKIDDIDLSRRILHVLECIPSNILRWFEQDIYSSRNSRLYYNYLNESKSYLAKNLVASLIIRQLPDDWKLPITSYLKSLDENSFYLSDSINSMIYTYSSQPTTDEDAAALKELIRIGIARFRVQMRSLTPFQIDRIVPNKDLPKRHSEENESCDEK